MLGRGVRVMTNVDTLRTVPKPKMVMRSQYVPLKLWEKAKAVADENEQNISDAVREGLELYIKKRGKR
jgi:hypothetical protein